MEILDLLESFDIFFDYLDVVFLDGICLFNEALTDLEVDLSFTVCDNFFVVKGEFWIEVMSFIADFEEEENLAFIELIIGSFVFFYEE